MDLPPHAYSATSRLNGTGRHAEDVSAELASLRTALSLQRTRLSADRTLMTVVGTGTTLVAIGFVTYQAFQNLVSERLAGPSQAARLFGASLVYIGVLMLAIGVLFHLRFMRGLQIERRTMVRRGLVHGERRFPESFMLLAAILLLFVGLAAVAGVSLHAGPMR